MSAFTRPAFMEIMEPAEQGLVANLVVKDHSRLGRNHLVVGQLLEQDFVRLNVRYIAIMDSIDTANRASDIVPMQDLYIRVSTRNQNEDRQLAALNNLGISEVNLFLDKQSGKDFNRPACRKLIKKLKPGDLLIIKSIDRLGHKIRSKAETCTGNFNERAVIRTGKRRHKIHRSDK